MALPTTCIGAFPKPDYLRVSNWSEESGDDPADTDAHAFAYVARESDQPQLVDRATREAVADQVACGIDVPTDGEQRRENYIHYHCRHLQGIDFQHLTRKVHRDSAAVADVPTIVGKIGPRPGHFLDRDFRVAQACTEKPIKLTVPGPVTIIDTTADQHYDDDRQLAFDLADAINYELCALADAGCRHIQVDEPLFARNVEAALNYGIESLDRCFAGLPDSVIRVMHMCCGYPGHLDDDDYKKADPQSYALLARAVDESSIDQVSIEDAHCHNDLRLLESFSDSTVILGSVAVATSSVESIDEIAGRLRDALVYIDRDRLVAAPDCGLMMLGRELAMQKLHNLSAATKLV